MINFIKRNYTVIVPVLLALVACGFLYISLALSMDITAIDYVPLHAAAELMNEKRDIYSTNAINEKLELFGYTKSANRYLYPPFPAAAIYLLSLAEIKTAVVVWTLICIVTLVASAYLLTFFFPAEKRSLIFLVVLISFVFFYPNWFSLILGQINTIVLMLMLGGIALLAKKYDFTAGALIAVAALIKIFPVIIIVYLLVTKRFRAVVGSIVIGLTSIIFTMMIGGFHAVHYYIKFAFNILPSLLNGSYWIHGEIGPSLPIHIANNFNLPSVAYAMPWLVIALYAILFIYIVKNSKKTQDGINLEISLLILAALLFSNYIFHHHLIWALFPLVVLFRSALVHREKIQIILIIILFILLALPPWLINPLIQNINHEWTYQFDMQLYSLIILFLANIFQLRQYYIHPVNTMSNI